MAYRKLVIALGRQAVVRQQSYTSAGPNTAPPIFPHILIAPRPRPTPPLTERGVVAIGRPHPGAGGGLTDQTLPHG